MYKFQVLGKNSIIITRIIHADLIILIKKIKNKVGTDCYESVNIHNATYKETYLYENFRSYNPKL